MFLKKKKDFFRTREQFTSNIFIYVKIYIYIYIYIYIFQNYEIILKVIHGYNIKYRNILTLPTYQKPPGLWLPQDNCRKHIGMFFLLPCVTCMMLVSQLEIEPRAQQFKCWVLITGLSRNSLEHFLFKDKVLKYVQFYIIFLFSNISLS